MAISPQRRQKKLERKRAKQKAKRGSLARRQDLSLASQLHRVAAAPILHCCTNGDIWEQGIGHLLVSRELNNGQVAFGVFLVDLYCLGVKDAFGGITSRADYDERIHQGLARHGGLKSLAPAAARKVVQGAVGYAAQFDLDPHPDFRKVEPIFGNIDPAECTQEFDYGHDGEPFFVAGPYDSPVKCQRILATLRQHCGEGGYDFLLPIAGSTLIGDGPWDAHDAADGDWDEDDGEEEEGPLRIRYA